MRSKMTRDEYLSRAYEFAHTANRSMTMDQADEIRRRYAGGESQRSIADQLGLHKNTVWKIVNYLSYAN